MVMGNPQTGKKTLSFSEQNTECLDSIWGNELFEPKTKAVYKKLDTPFKIMLENDSSIVHNCRW